MRKTEADVVQQESQDTQPVFSLKPVSFQFKKVSDLLQTNGDCNRTLLVNLTWCHFPKSTGACTGSIKLI